MININPNKNESLVKSCKPMYDYVRLVGRISANKKAGMKIEQAVSEAVGWAIEENFLEGFVREQKEEIIGMYLTEYNEERAIRNWRQDGIIEGAQQKALEDALMLVKKYNATPETAAQDAGAPLDKVLEALKETAN